MRILMVIHGYPPTYNAGSEIYTQSIARELASRHEVRVFTRQEEPLLPAYATTDTRDPGDARVRLRVINIADATPRYRHERIDRALESLVDDFKPDVVHVNHLSHLSTSVVQSIAMRAIPIVFTLHDFWLMCPRGQFIQQTPGPGGEPYPLCDGQDDRKCAERCYSMHFSNSPERHELEVRHWQGWIGERMRHVREACGMVDAFIAPSRHLLDRHCRDFGIPASKIRYLAYGFDQDRFGGRARTAERTSVLGYIGTHIPAKGIQLLLTAFGRINGEPLLRIWGRTREPHTSLLQSIAARLPGDAARRVEWMGEYRNERIVDEVFNRIDCIVVPSIWAENSPLVIHEAQQARVPVITADAGGMSELVRDGINGLLFRHRDPESMARAIQRFVEEPLLGARLGSRGYLGSESGDVPSIGEHAKQLEEIYREVSRGTTPADASGHGGPWRITFDTNPDDCNLQCIMCEEHSPHSGLQAARRASGLPKRRMDVGLLRLVLEQTRGTGLREIIPSTMGEPLLYRDFDRIIDLCREFGVRMNLTTNGTFPGRGARAWARRIVPVTSDTKISLNGATAATQQSIMIGTDFDRVIEGVREFVDERNSHARSGGNYCRVTFQTTFLESNIGELPNIVRLAASLDVDRVKGHHLWAHFVQIEGLSMRRSRSAAQRWNSVVAATVEAAASSPRADGKLVLLENIHPIDPDAPGDIAPGGPCPFLGREAWVSAEGRFGPCCAPDAQRRSLGDFGNVAEKSLMEIWNGQEYRNLRATYRERPLCQGCNMRRPGDSG